MKKILPQGITSPAAGFLSPITSVSSIFAKSSFSVIVGASCFVLLIIIL
jgi:hypothetical protein